LTLSVIEIAMNILVCAPRRSRWLCSLRRRTAAAWLWDCRFESCWSLGFDVHVFVFVVSCVGCGPCDGQITSPDKYYWSVCIKFCTRYLITKWRGPNLRYCATEEEDDDDDDDDLDFTVEKEAI